MRRYLATEVQLIATNYNSRQANNKAVLDALEEYSMYTISEAAKKGAFSVLIDLDEQNPVVLQTFSVAMRSLGYKVEQRDSQLYVNWE